MFLVSLATAKRVSEIQALSKAVAAIGNDVMVSYMPHFIAKTEHADAPVPRSFRILSLREFAGDLEEGSLLCPVRALMSVCGELVLLLLEPLLCLSLLIPPLV